MLEFADAQIRFRVACSKGTYVRASARHAATPFIFGEVGGKGSLSGDGFYVAMDLPPGHAPPRMAVDRAHRGHAVRVTIAA